MGLKYLSCDDCIDPETNPGYHMVVGYNGFEIPERVHHILDPHQFKQPLMLDIGAGGLSSDDKFTSVDLVTEADITATMWAIPLPDGSVDAIWSSNALEHIGKFEVAKTLQEWWRLLKPEGKLQLVIPDLEWAVNWWLANQEDEGWSLDIIYGHQLHEGEYHKTGFTPKIITNHFERSARPWLINSIYYQGGEILPKDVVGQNIYETNVNQRLIVVEAMKIENLDRNESING